ncbi:hypothetical protein FTW19_02955 [Terriglobus albidus]|uniref:Uncharacterized protein n=1 Tax=Terriglobus albidus TaxID=1592106 RepID=A0A5B9E8Z6_9BACT|nr:hypothetical protein [Terriglobus albidus]QEE27060.1 hypothetical protein FTW19_02955 [Terriglobus albidus]
MNDLAALKNLLILWLVVTTKTGSNGHAYLDDLRDPTAQAALAHRLGVSPGTVKNFYKKATGSFGMQFQNVQESFHDLVKAELGGPYQGDFCPLAIDAIENLISTVRLAQQSTSA